jgi:hypothetical protein
MVHFALRGMSGLARSVNQAWASKSSGACCVVLSAVVSLLGLKEALHRGLAPGCSWGATLGMFS